MKLLLIRHAKTDPSSPTGNDFDRKLLPRGLRQCHDLRDFLQNVDVQIETILCSTAERTKQTFMEISSSVNCPACFLNSLYLADRQLLLHEITMVKNNKDLLVIGHNDGISDLASYLTGEHIYLKTGMLWILEFHGNSWEELSAETALATGYYRSDYR